MKGNGIPMRTSTTKRTRTTARTALLGAAIAALLAAGCGDDDDSGGGSKTTGDSGGGQVAEAKKLLAEQEKAVTTFPELPSFTVGDKLRGKTIAYIAANKSFPFTQNVIGGVEDAAKVTGMSVRVSDSKGDPSAASRLIDQAIAEKADVILLQGSDPAAVKAALGHAKDADVPVVSVAAITAGPVSAPLEEAGLSANASFDYKDVGTRLADFVVADSGGKAKVGLITVSSFPVSGTVQKSFNAELDRLCADCSVTTDDSPVTQWQTSLSSLTRTLVTKNPDMNYLVPMFDAMVLFSKPAVEAAGAADRVKIASQNASAPDMKAIAEGGDPEVADVGSPTEWLGWAAADQASRLLSGESAIPSEEVPNRTFTAKNVGDLDLDGSQAPWYGPVDFESSYQKLWGVE